MGNLMYSVYKDFAVIQTNQLVRIQSDVLQFNSVQRAVESA
jgi:hypothetical protein